LPNPRAVVKKDVSFLAGMACGSPYLIISTTFLTLTAKRKSFIPLAIYSFSFLPPGFAALFWFIRESIG